MYKSTDSLNDNGQLNKSPQGDNESIDLKRVVSKVLHNWYLFALSTVLCVVLAVLFANFTSPSWTVSSKILVKDSKNNPSSAIGGSVNADIGSLFNVKSNADNEIQILRSRSILVNTVQQMMLNVRTYKYSGIKAHEIYDEAPFSLDISYKVDTLMPRVYIIKVLDENRCSIVNSKDDVDIITGFDKTVKLGQYDIKLVKKRKIVPDEKYKITIESKDATVDAFVKLFSVGLSDKQATTIDLTLDYPNPKKGEAILDKIMQIYLLSNLQNEVRVADSTMKFINDRIAEVGEDLTNIEDKLERYKEQNNLVNISEQSKVLVASASNYSDKLIQQQVQLSVVRDLERFLNDPVNKKAVPTSLIIPTADPSFGQAINSYNELVINRDKASLSYTEGNPIIQNYNKQIDYARVSLLRNLESYKKGLVVSKEQLQKQNNNFSGQLKEIPSKERNYLDFARQQNLKQEIYLYLLQKREETAISKTSTISSSRILDPAKSEFLPHSPKKMVIYIVGLILGLLIPCLYLFIKELLNIRLETKSDIENSTNVPILGEIGHNKDSKQSLVTGTNSRSVISEQFRGLRTNLQFVLDQSKPNVLLFTSSMSGEGKSFLSLNLGSVIALTGKKVVFMELDLRKPKLSESIGLTNEYGYTNYAISEDPDFEMQKIIKTLSFNENSFLISSGPIPPNPAELLLNGKIEKLITYLKTKYDYILIDCAPVGLVADALLLEKFADVTLYVARQNFTYKSHLNILNELYQQKKFKNLYLLINDIKAQKAGYSSYGQSYGYGYGIEEEKNKSVFKFWDK